MVLTPTPQNAGEIAKIAVAWALENYGTRLHYNVPSLQQVDGILDDLRVDQKFEAMQPLLFSLGCYVGEVFVRSAGGRWSTTEELKMAAATSPIVVRMRDGRGCNPVGKVYKRFQNGPDESLVSFYEAMTAAPAAIQPKE